MRKANAAMAAPRRPGDGLVHARFFTVHVGQGRLQPAEGLKLHPSNGACAGLSTRHGLGTLHAQMLGCSIQKGLHVETIRMNFSASSCMKTSSRPSKPGPRTWNRASRMGPANQQMKKQGNEMLRWNRLPRKSRRPTWSWTKTRGLPGASRRVGRPWDHLHGPEGSGPSEDPEAGSSDDEPQTEPAD